MLRRWVEWCALRVLGLEGKKRTVCADGSVLFGDPSVLRPWQEPHTYVPPGPLGWPSASRYPYVSAPITFPNDLVPVFDDGTPVPHGTKATPLTQVYKNIYDDDREQAEADAKWERIDNLVEDAYAEQVRHVREDPRFPFMGGQSTGGDGYGKGA